MTMLDELAKAQRTAKIGSQPIVDWDEISPDCQEFYRRDVRAILERLKTSTQAMEDAANDLYWGADTGADDEASPKTVFVAMIQAILDEQ